ncbi:Suppressor of lurcher protein 1-like protein [Dinothrombium tinctorium]|uniref:Suppressor of lurcher protein 1-like protein n=1 Tax=Dinothrombium tinctorium TaxID=1965070 RepID=A0A3S4R0T6_9ACAR|nr:Suppressor of lurcher protein 1-like protein [Dinothrombium tinctorium]RWS10151.1 Suppressor of lurcher protein 1-like protein [Dinothrombium tinctorium]RWS16958.1 Suppressor of lurcher protein 1-like protein [Dinothrombium tinctorium]
MRCEESDTVMVFVTINGNKERIDNYCGNQIPLQIMSNGPSLTAEFKSLDGKNHRAKGFRAIYKFVKDFGIQNGIQDQKRGDKKRIRKIDFPVVCAFVYNSNTHPNGTITSPNWPGLYPRDTECHYFFYGQKNEKVYITFPHFDVEGVPP